MLLEHERNYGLGMDALVIALTKTRTELWLGHGCSGETMLVTRGLIRVLEAFVSILGETWGRREGTARPLPLPGPLRRERKYELNSCNNT